MNHCSRSFVQKLEQVHADYPASVTHVGTAVRGNTEHAELLLGIVRQTEYTEPPINWRLSTLTEAASESRAKGPPALGGDCLYLAGMRGHLVCLRTGREDADGWYMWGGNARHNKTV